METLKKLQQFKLPLSYQKLKILFIFLILLIFIMGVMEGVNDGNVFWGVLRKESGELAWRLLIFIIFISLFSKLFPKIKIFKQFLPLRKEAGILMFLIAFGHAIFHYFKTGVFGDLSGMFSQSFQNNWVVLLGTIALIIALPLFLTSNTFSAKKMEYKSWKKLQRFTHLVFILSAIHVAFIEYPKHQEIERGPLVVLTIYLVGYGYLFWKKRR